MSSASNNLNIYMANAELEWKDNNRMIGCDFIDNNNVSNKITSYQGYILQIQNKFSLFSRILLER